MTSQKPMPSDAALVAIDVAKYRNEVLIHSPGRVRRRRLTALNTRDDHDRMIKLLSGLGCPVIVGLEATGCSSSG